MRIKRLIDNVICVVKFKLNNIILESYVLERDSNNNEIYPKIDWNNYEIDIFKDNRLIYSNPFLKIYSLIIDLSLNTQRTTQKKLLTVDKKVNYNNVSNELYIHSLLFLMLMQFQCSQQLIHLLFL